MNNAKKNITRKQFLKFGGVTAAAIMGLGRCTEVPNSVDTEPLPPFELGPDPRPNGPLWLGTGDVGLLNFVHIYVKLEATFYSKILLTPYIGMTPKEHNILTDIKNHEIAHSNFLEVLLEDNTVGDVQFNFSYFDFSNRNEILKAAFRFENIGVSVYNHFGELFARDDLFLALAKLGSVEGRHAASLQFLLNPAASFLSNKFIDENGLDVINTPESAYGIISKYLFDGLDINGLPKVKIAQNEF